MTTDLNVTLPAGTFAVALFNGDGVLVLRDDDADNANQLLITNPVTAATLAARLRTWADLLDSASTRARRCTPPLQMPSPRPGGTPHPDSRVRER